ncbi:hypothetical protein EJV47_00445 [Hymenobacter gummosus]|uniref:Uncharacterized protein n=1 Tax=Hymenobacter gummosus TaxID=1776032 RepID=A0A431U7J7_9BACT|nr:hypothetical protein [Hymenobacter gummosus]RTQ53244.1 hypothetical protein EJV47_00445 [Hymenobacter gummosus]
MKHRLLLLIATASAALAACDKDPETATPTTPDASFLPLQTGNYWVYRQYRIDGRTGVATATNILDSCFISKDTLIRGQRYYKLVRPVLYSVIPDNRIVRDSLHYLVDHHGRRLFSSQDATNILDTEYSTLNQAGRTDTVVRMVSRMMPQDTTISTAAGTFTVKKHRKTHIFYPSIFPGYQPRVLHTRYAKDVGIVTEMLPFYAADPDYTERRLIRYRVQ